MSICGDFWEGRGKGREEVGGREGRNAYRVVGIGCVPRCGEQEDGMVVVGAEGLFVHVPQVVVRGVGAEGDVDVLRGGGVL